ncbi:hypothetical protein HQ560_12610 [bacterium]|nr:hypothetical protein [bacterium]
MTARLARILLLGTAVALAGCAGTKASLLSRIPKKANSFAKGFIHDLMADKTDDAGGKIGLPLRPEDIDKGNADVARLRRRDQYQDFQPVGVRQFVFASEGRSQRTSIDYQIEFENAYVVVSVVVETRKDEEGEDVMTVTSFRTDEVEQRLQDQNVLGFSDLGTGHYVFITVAVVVLLATIAAVLMCVFGRGSRKVLWILLILMGVGSVRFNWTTGDQRYALLTLPQFPSIRIAQESAYAPWHVSMGLPLGVVLFVMHRRRLKRRPAAAPAKPAPVSAAPAPPAPEPEPMPPPPVEDTPPEPVREEDAE